MKTLSILLLIIISIIILAYYVFKYLFTVINDKFNELYLAFNSIRNLLAAKSAVVFLEKEHVYCSNCGGLLRADNDSKILTCIMCNSDYHLTIDKVGFESLTKLEIKE